MARKTDRNFLVPFASLDIEYLPAKGPEVSDDIQMVYVLGDATTPASTVFGTGLQSLPVPEDAAVTAVSRLIAATVGERATMELVVAAGISGCWVSPMASGSQVPFKVWTIEAASGLGTTIVPTVANSTIFGLGTLPASTVDFGTQVSASPVSSWQLRLGQDAGNILYGPTIFMGPGRVLVIEREFENVAAICGFIWRELA